MIEYAQKKRKKWTKDKGVKQFIISFTETSSVASWSQSQEEQTLYDKIMHAREETLLRIFSFIYLHYTLNSFQEHTNKSCIDITKYK